MVLLADFGTEVGSLWTAATGMFGSWFFWIGLFLVLIWYLPKAVSLVRRTTPDDELPGPDCVTKRMELIAKKEADIAADQEDLAALRQENIDMANILTGGPPA